MHGYDMYDFHARGYYPAIMRFTSPDPHAESYYHISPYAYCANNPIRYVDPDGKKVVLSGKGSRSILNQVRQHTTMSISRNKSGTMKVKGRPQNDADRLLVAAINDENITVNIKSTTEATLNRSVIIGGAYEGSVVNEDGSVYTYQTVNPNMTAIIDAFYEMEEGTTAMHEILESYIGGVLHPGNTFNSNSHTEDDRQKYLDAHNAAMNADPDFVEPIPEADRTNMRLIRPSYWKTDEGMMPGKELLIY